MPDPHAAFHADTTGCGVMFLSSAARHPSTAHREADRDILRIVTELYREGWRLSVDDMLTGGAGGPIAYDTSAFSAVSFMGLFEAPTISAAIAGIGRLDDVGWSDRYPTEWALGPREFAPVGAGAADARFGFAAFWEWNDAWCVLPDRARAEYDQTCDMAFRSDLDARIAISGRHRADLNTRWHHFAMWDVPELDDVTRAMADHEAVADFRLTTSRHYIGVRQPLDRILGGPHG